MTRAAIAAGLLLVGAYLWLLRVLRDVDADTVDDYAEPVPMTWTVQGNDHTYRVALDRATGKYRTTEV